MKTPTCEACGMMVCHWKCPITYPVCRVVDTVGFDTGDTNNPNADDRDDSFAEALFGPRVVPCIDIDDVMDSIKNRPARVVVVRDWNDDEIPF